MAKKKTKRLVRNAWEKRTIQNLIEDGMPEEKASDPKCLLAMAISENQTKEAMRQIDFGVDVNDPRDYVFEGSGSMTPFQFAAMRGNLELVQYMAERAGADPNHCGEEGVALHYAAKYGHEKIGKYLKPFTDRKYRALADRYFQGGKRSREENEAIQRLFQASVMGQMPTVKKLLDHGVDVNADLISHHGQSAIHAASSGGQIKVLEFLIEAGADPNAEAYNGVAPLAVAANDDICKALLKAGAKVDHVSHQGCTALMHAIHHDMFTRLVKAGAKMKTVDKNGLGVLWHIAIAAKQKKAFSYPKPLKIDAAFDKDLASTFGKLVKAGVSVNDKHPVDGVTALMAVASLNLQASAEVLLKAGANVSEKDAEGRAALDYAKNRSPLQKRLREAEDAG